MSERPIPLDWPDDVELSEPSIISSLYFTGIRTAVVDGVAHLLFCAQQPSYGGNGGTESVVVARMVAPLARAKTILDAAAGRLAYGSLPDQSTRAIGVDEERRH